MAGVCSVNFSLSVSQILYELKCFSPGLFFFYVGLLSRVHLYLLQNYINIPENYFSIQFKLIVTNALILCSFQNNVALLNDFDFWHLVEAIS